MLTKGQLTGCHILRIIRKDFNMTACHKCKIILIIEVKNMPSETFLRLTEEKRTRLVDAAWEEVLRVPFEEMSINKIILRARIPRGSFYQYFTDKKDPTI